MTSPARTIAIGDVHGCSAALDAILGAIDPRPDDTLITLGDYINRGPDSRGVIERLLQLRAECRLVPLLGNHEEVLLEARRGIEPEYFLAMGGAATLASYGPPAQGGGIPGEHIAFLESCLTFFETDTHIFIHANYDPDLPMAEQDRETLLWESLRRQDPRPAPLGQDRHHRPHRAEGWRDPRPGLPEVHRHLLLRGRLAHGPRGGDRAALAGRPPRPDAAPFKR